ncbi:hypothetical protein CEXT_38771 [Caerostris extrusa]|uniref:Uncharacterized protein n=1 Tax=Caerostris extrusa TaxID=172846 RepID=A0AAV4UIJ1_CAEEX|nr:hypothetical protein CEXT_38771 [Caerostris extrusa]
MCENREYYLLNDERNGYLYRGEWTFSGPPRSTHAAGSGCCAKSNTTEKVTPEGHVTTAYKGMDVIVAQSKKIGLTAGLRTDQ